jgi:cytochrome oxidase complex assembly protein 1
MRLTAMDSPGQIVNEPKKSFPPWVKTLIIVLSIGFTLALMGVAALVYVIFYQIKESQPAKLSVAVVKNSPEVQGAVGENEKIGWPIGSVSVEGGGSGQASFSFKVKGSKGEGKAYTTLKKINGQWYLESGRFQVKNGPSLNLHTTEVALGGVSGGRQLRSNPSVIQNWREVKWPNQDLTLRVPADWMEIKNEPEGIEYRPEDRSAYFIGNATYFDQVIPFHALLQQDLQTKANKLERGEIKGYKQLSIGAMEGILEMQNNKAGSSLVTWTGYRDTPKYGTESITFLLGSTSLGSFGQAEPILGAILDSIH